MEDETIGTDPGVFLIVIAVVEDFTAETFISVVSGEFEKNLYFRN